VALNFVSFKYAKFVKEYLLEKYPKSIKQKGRFSQSGLFIGFQ